VIRAKLIQIIMTFERKYVMRKMFLSLLLACLGLAALLLAAGCIPRPSSSNRSPNCKSDEEYRPGNIYTGRKEALATVGTLCSDKERYELGETVHFTMTVKNALDEPIVLGDGQSPAMGISMPNDGGRSDYLPPVPTRIELQPSQAYTLTWSWPSPDVDVEKARGSLGWVDVYGDSVGLDGGRGVIQLVIGYGPIFGPP
jgi:hypothetical protein